MNAKESFIGVLSVLIIGVFIIYGYFIMSGDIRTTDPQLLLLIGSAFGAAQTYASVVVGYWFGSTKGSADKNLTISTIADKLPSTPSTQTIVATATTSNKEPSP